MARLVLAATLLMALGVASASHPEFLYCTEPDAQPVGPVYIYRYQWHQEQTVEVWQESNGQGGLQRNDCPENRGTDTLLAAAAFP